MLAHLSPVVVLSLCVFSLTWADTTTEGQAFKCTMYDRANTTTPSCNDHYTCAGPCSDPYITAQNCYLISDDTDFLGHPKPGKPDNPAVPTVVCDVGYGRNTAAAKTCLTSTATYSCDGGSVQGTYATCYGCVEAGAVPSN